MQYIYLFLSIIIILKIKNNPYIYNINNIFSKIDFFYKIFLFNIIYNNKIFKDICILKKKPQVLIKRLSK